MIASIQNKDRYTYDAIVVGSGISGGWAAKELCEGGLNTLLLERGRDVRHIVDYPTAMLHPWQFDHRLRNTLEDGQESPIQSTGYDAGDKLFYVKDKEHPYTQVKPFHWFRGHQVGGRSLIWGRQCYRLSDLDFTANTMDGHGTDWPIRYADVQPWYDYVESYIGISGQCEHLPHLPDGNFLPPMDLNCIEKHLRESIRRLDKTLTIARVANLTKGWKGRNACVYRNLCSRGCPYGGYFSSNSATIPAATATGRLTLRPFSVVTEIIYDESTEKATGVRVTDMLTLEVYEFYAKIIFINASTIATAAILLNSKSPRFPDGLGNDSGQVGRNLMDHHSTAGVSGVHEGFKEYYYQGRRPCGFLIPRFQNLRPGEHLEFVRGYNMQGLGRRQGWQDHLGNKGFGKDFKAGLTAPGPWTVWMAGWGECLPYAHNRITLETEKKDKWGMPTIAIDFTYGENESAMKRHIQENGKAMLEAAGFVDIDVFDYNKAPGSTVHEMGTARMGKDPSTSVLNGHNQVHAVKNVFITDGSCMASSACQNPSLTYMALTARACAFALDQLKKKAL